MSSLRIEGPLVLLALTALLTPQGGCGSNEVGGSLGEVGTYEPSEGGTFTGSDASASRAIDAQVEQNGIQVDVVALSCAGGCATVEAVATGGQPPYTFSWGDGSTSPTRQLCPTADVTYHVTVTDSGAAGEFASPPATAAAQVTADVLASCPDGGGAPPDASVDGEAAGACVDPGDAPWTGCESIAIGSPNPPGPSPFGGWCATPGAAGSEWSYALCLPKALLAGQTYSLQVTYQLTNLTGPVSESGVAGSTGACAASQGLLPLQSWPIALTPYSGTFTQSACVTADARYPELLYEEIDGDLHSNPTYRYTFTICAGCGGDR
jgi:hypothetical protein